MPTNYTDQFFTFDPANPPPVGASVTVSVLTMTDQNDDDNLDDTAGDSVDGSNITSSWPGDTVTLNVPGVGEITYTGITFYLADGRRFFTPTDGKVLQDGTFVSSTFVSTEGPLDVGDLGPPCFTRGTLIRTPGGEVAVEQLMIGDVVSTQDRGVQKIVWCGSRKVTGEGKFAPVELKVGLYGNRAPIRLSQQHRVLLTDWRCQLYFGQAEMLVAAKHLVDGDKVKIVPVAEVEYIHVMFAEHEIIWAEGMPCESFNPNGAFARQDREVASELHKLFPQLPGIGAGAKPTARPIMRKHEANLIDAAS